MGIMLAIENADNEFGAENLEVAADQAAIVGEDRAEVAEVAADIESDVADVAQADADAAELDEIGEVAQAAVDSGEGLSEQAAEVATIAIERIHNRLGFSGKQRIIAATESFGHANTRLASTKLVVESISETIKSIWEAIKAMAKRIWDKISAFFKKIFGSAKSLRDHLENLKKRAQNIAADAKEKEKELTGALVKKISVNKKADMASYKEIVDNSLALATISGSIAAESAGVASGVTSLTAGLQSAGVNQTNLNSFAHTLDSSYGKIAGLMAQLAKVNASGVSAKRKKPTTSKTTVKSTVTYGPFAHGQVIVAENLAKTFSVGGSSVSFNSVSISFETMGEKEFADKAKALNKGEIVAVLDLAIKCASEAEDMEKNAKNIQKVIDESQKAADNVLKATGSMVEKDGSSNARVAMNEAREAISSVFGLVNQLGQRIPAALINAGYAGADYASASIANYR